MPRLRRPRRPSPRAAAPARRRPSALKDLERLEDRCLFSASPSASAAYGRLPLASEPNLGQTDPRVGFLSHGSGYTLFLSPTKAILSLQPTQAGPNDKPEPGQAEAVTTSLVGANPAATATALDRLPGVSNYLISNDPSRWHTNVPNFGTVAYHGVYPGIDVVYYGNQRQLEYDFVITPGADPSAVRLAFTGIQGIGLDPAGNLVLHAAGGDVVEHAPVVYQPSGQTRQEVSGHYVVLPGNQAAFAVGHYDPARPLVIDPVLNYSTYLGGSGFDNAYAVAVDASGNAYVAGYTGSPDFPTQAPLQPTNHGGYDAFVARIAIPPVISSITPAQEGTTSVVIVSGSNFTPTSTVLWNGSPLLPASVAFQSASSLQVTLGSVLEEGTVPVSVSNTGVLSNAFSLVVTDAPLTDQTSAATLNATAGSSTGARVVARFSDANPSAPASDFTSPSKDSFIDWGDGSQTTLLAPSDATALGNGLFQVSGSHTYASAGTYTVTVTINDIGGQAVQTTRTQFLVSNPQNTLSICGVVNDNSGKGLPNWEVDLTFPSGSKIPALTDSSDAYSFNGLGPGNYTVTDVLQPGWLPLQPPQLAVPLNTVPAGHIDFQNFQFAQPAGKTLIVRAPSNTNNIIAVHLPLGFVQVDGYFYPLALSSTSVVAVTGGGGPDTLYIYAKGTGETAYLVPPTSTSVLSAPAYQVSFQKVPTAYATLGTGEWAILGGSASDDDLVAHPGYAKLVNHAATNLGKFDLEAFGFGTAVAWGNGGGDTALLYGPAAGGTTFYAHPISDPTTPSSTLVGSGFALWAYGFPTVTAGAFGPSNTAYLYGSAGNDVFTGQIGDSNIKYAVNSANRATGFQTVYAVGGQGGSDQAVFLDTPRGGQPDTFVGTSTNSCRQIGAQVVSADGFAGTAVVVLPNSGDTVWLVADAPGGSTLTLDQQSATLSSTTSAASVAVNGLDAADPFYAEAVAGVDTVNRKGTPVYNPQLVGPWQ